MEIFLTCIFISDSFFLLRTLIGVVFGVAGVFLVSGATVVSWSTRDFGAFVIFAIEVIFVIIFVSLMVLMVSTVLIVEFSLRMVSLTINKDELMFAINILDSATWLVWKVIQRVNCNVITNETLLLPCY